MATFTAEEFKKKFGEQAYNSFGTSTPKAGGIGADISSAFKGGLDYAKQGVEDSRNATNLIEKTEAGLKIGAGAVGAAFSPLAPLTKYIGKAIDYTADKVSDNPAVQKFAMSDAGKTTARVAEDVQNISALMSLRGGGKAPAIAKATTEGVMKPVTGVANAVGGATSKIAGATKEIVPGLPDLVEHNFAQAFRLTPGDLTNIKDSTGNNAGIWVAEKNLIGTNPKETISNIKGVYDDSYSKVRTEIANVDKEYTKGSVPGFADAVHSVEQVIGDTKGLEAEGASVENLMNKEVLDLKDVQSAKELVDKYYSLYKRSGDVKDSVKAQGMANIRSKLKKFIEKEVKDNGGEDIGELNNDVQTSRAILDAIDQRSSKGIASWNILAKGDMAVLGSSFFFGPVVGVGGYILKKIFETPSVKLKFARWADKLDDAQKAKIKNQLETGQIPEEFDQFIEIKP